MRNVSMMTRKKWEDMKRAHSYRCYYCGKYCSSLTRDHKLPKSRGGGYTVDNIVPSCVECNNLKGDKTEDEFIEFLLRREDERERMMQENSGASICLSLFEQDS